MKLLKKLAKNQSTRLILPELLVMASVSTVVCLLLYLSFGHADPTGIRLPIYLPIGFVLMGFTICKNEILSKIGLSLYLRVFAALYGVLFFGFLWLGETSVFLCLLAGACLMFCLSAYAGIRLKDKVNRKKLYFSCIVITICAMIGEAVYLMLASDPFNYIIAVAMGICGVLLNLADFSRIAQLYQTSMQSKGESYANGLMAQMLFANFCGCMIAADASRLVVKVFLYGELDMITNSKK